MESIFFSLGLLLYSGLRLLRSGSREKKKIMTLVSFGVIILFAVMVLAGEDAALLARVVLLVLSILVLGATMFYVGYQPFTYLSEIILLQSTILGWLAIFIYSEMLPAEIIWIAAFFSIFVFIDACSMKFHSLFMKLFFAIWYGLLSVGAALLCLLLYGKDLLIAGFGSAPAVGVPGAFMAGIVLAGGVHALSSAATRCLYLIKKAVRTRSQTSNWTAYYLQDQVSPPTALLLIVLWPSVFFLNQKTGFVADGVFIIAAFALVEELASYQAAKKDSWKKDYGKKPRTVEGVRSEE